jgi:hypothetical protein
VENDYSTGRLVGIPEFFGAGYKNTEIDFAEIDFAEVDFDEIDFGEMDITFVYVYGKAITIFFFLWDYGYPTKTIRENDINHEFIVS